jgi:YARHG domain
MNYGITAGRNMSLNRSAAIIVIAVAMLLSLASVSPAQSNAYSYVANTMPPDAFLALKMYPSSNSPRIMAMANGTKLDVLLRRVDGWWYVKVWPTGEEGWAFSGQGNKAWILCCAATDGAQTEEQPIARDISDFSCDQLWFGRNSIFKAAGYCFKTPRAIAAFGNAGCQYDDINAVRLSAEDQNFAEAIQQAEQAKACAR